MWSVWSVFVSCRSRRTQMISFMICSMGVMLQIFVPMCFERSWMVKPPKPNLHHESRYLKHWNLILLNSTFQNSPLFFQTPGPHTSWFFKLSRTRPFGPLTLLSHVLDRLIVWRQRVLCNVRRAPVVSVNVLLMVKVGEVFIPDC